jgi:methenyltetrahydrofolate cyclohydrolase
VAGGETGQHGDQAMNQAEGTLADLPLDELLAQFAAPTPAPGGGSAIALACALAAALVEMTAGFAPSGQAGEVGPRAAELRAQALHLAQAELHSYAPVLEALRLPVSDEQREPLLREALSSASAALASLAAVGAELTELAAAMATTGSPLLAGDAAVAAILAASACRGAARLVEINLAGDPEDPRRRASAELAGEAVTAQEKAWLQEGTARADE